MTTNTIIFPAPGAQTAYQFSDTFISTELPSFGKLLTYYNTADIETDSPTYINSQYNVSYDIAKWCTFDSNLLTKKIRTPIVTQTIYLNNTDKYGSILYRKNTNIKLTYLGTGFSKIIAINDASTISITFDIFDGFPIVNTSGLRLVNISSDTFPGTPVPSSPTSFPAPGALSAKKWDYKFNTVNLPDAVTSKLSWFDNVSSETDDPVYVSSQYNLIYNIIDWYIKESVLLTSTTKTITSTQTLYFDNIINNGLRYRKNHSIKISYDITGFSAVVQIINSDYNSITFTTVDGFPTLNQGGLRLVLVTMEVYPRNLVRTETLNTKGIKITNPTTARENLFATEISPNLRGVQFFTNRSFASVATLPVVSVLPTYSSPTIIGDNNFPLINQSVNVSTTNTSVNSWYTYDLDILTYTSTVQTVKTVFFADQLVIPFPTGSTVRIRNVLTNYSKTFTVTLGTLNSVTLNYTDSFATDGTFIDNFSSTVYRQSDVSTVSSPTTARENLYYFNISPGLRSSVRDQQISVASNRELSFLAKPMIRVVADPTIISLSVLSKLKYAPLVSFETPVTSKVSSVSKLSGVTPVLSTNTVTNVRVVGSQVFETPTGNAALPIAMYKLVASTSVLSVNNVSNLKVIRSQIFETPVNNTLPKSIFKLIAVAPTYAVPLTTVKLKVVADKSIIQQSAITKSKLSNVAAFVTPTHGLTKLYNTTRSINSNLLSSFAETYTDQRSVMTINPPVSAAENLFYSKIFKFGVTSTTGYKNLADIKLSTTVYSTSEATENIIYKIMNPLGIATGVPYKSTYQSLIPASASVSSDVVSNYDNVSENNKIYVNGQLAVYDVVSWYIYEDQIVKSTTPTAGITQTLFFDNAQSTKIFYPNNYVKIEQITSGFSATVQLLSSTLGSITFTTIIGFPNNITNMSITGMSNPVYSKALVAAQLMQYGIIQQTTLPRENLLAVEMAPNLRGVTFTTGNYAASPRENVSSYRLEVFQDSKLVGDYKLPIINETPNIVTLTNNIVSWNIYDSNIITVTTANATIKTFFFIPQAMVPFASGSTIKLSNGFTSVTATVILGTMSSVTVNQLSVPLSIDNLFIERITSSVYPQALVSTIVSPTNARENLYYSLIRPLNKSTAGLGSSSLIPASGNIQALSFRTLRGDNAKLSVNSALVSVKVVGDKTITLSGNLNKSISKLVADKSVTVSGNLNKQLVKLVADRKYPSTELASTTSTTAVLWSTNLIYVSGISGYSTTPAVASWYAFESNLITSTLTNTALVTLYTGSTVPKGGDQIRIFQPNASYDRIFTIVSSNSTSITINNPYNLPSISGMYFIWGRTSTTSSVTYTNTNSVPLVTNFKQFQTNIFEVPSSSAISKQIFKVKNDTAVIKSGTLAFTQIATLKGLPTYSSKSLASSSTLTAPVWDTTPIYVVGRSGYSTTPSVANWYAFENNTINSVYTASNTITLYIGMINMRYTGNKVRILQPNASFDRIFTVISSTPDSITIQDPGNFPNISAMYFLWSSTISTTTVTYTTDNSVPVVNAYKTSATQVFNTPVLSVMTKQLLTLRDVPVKISIDRAIMQSIKVVSDRSVVASGNLIKQIAKLVSDKTVILSGTLKNKQLLSLTSAELVYPSKSVLSTTSTPITVWSSNVYVTGISGNTTTPTVQSWYAFESNILKSFNTNAATVTLYFNPLTNVNYGTSIRIIQPNASYDRTATVISYTNRSVTINTPDNIPPISDMYFTWGRVTNTSTVTYTDNNQTGKINKLPSVRISEILNVPQVSSVLMKSTIRGEVVASVIKSAKLETFDNIGITSGLKVDVIQTTENTIPITGITSKFTNNSISWYINETGMLRLLPALPKYKNNVVSWYTYESNIVTLTKVDPISKVTLYFGPTLVTVGDTVTLVSYTSLYYKVVSVLSSTKNSITIVDPFDLPSISNLHIYLNTTAFVVPDSIAGFSRYVKVATSASVDTIIAPVVSSNYYSVTFVKPRATFNTDLAKVSVTIEDASPSVYAFWQQASTPYAAHDAYLKSRMITPASTVSYTPVNYNSTITDSQLPVGKASSSAALSSVQNYLSKTVSTVITTPTINWSNEQLIITGRSGISTLPTVATWYIRDDLYNVLNVYKSGNSTVTLYFKNTKSIRVNKVRVVQFIENFDNVFDVISSTTSSVTFTAPINFPSISGMYIYLGVNSVTESIAYTTTNVIPFITKSPVVQLNAFTVPAVDKMSPRLVVRAENSVFKSSTITKLIVVPTRYMVFETPTTNWVKLSMAVRADTNALSVSTVKQIKWPANTNQVLETPTTNWVKFGMTIRADNTVLAVSNVKQTNKLYAEPSALSARQLEPFYNVKGLMDNSRPILTSTDTAILLSGRTSSYTNNVKLWYAYELDILSLTPIAPPTNITLSFYNTTGITIGSTVTLVQYNINYFKIVSVISSTANSITIENKNLPLGDLYIYFGTTVTFAPTFSVVFLANTTASITTAYGDNYSIQITSATQSSVSFVKTSAFDTNVSGLAIYSLTPSYYPQSLVTIPTNVPTNARQNLMFGLMSPALRRKSFEVATNTGIAPLTASSLKNVFKVAGETSYASKERKSISTTPVIKWADPVAVVGILANTANTVSWYINDSDVLKLTLTTPQQITLYLGAAIIPAYTSVSTVRLSQRVVNYSQSATVVSNTADSITIVNPGNLPSITAMTVELGYSTIESTVTYTTLNTIHAIDKFKTVNYASVSVPAISVTSQLFKLNGDNTKITVNKLNSYGVKNTMIFESPKVSSATIRYVVKPDISKLNISIIPYKKFRQDGLYTNNDFVVDQQSVIVNTPPVSAAENLFYSKLVPTKYGSLFVIEPRQFVDVNRLESLGRNESSRVNPNLFPILFPTGIVNLSILGTRLTSPNEIFKDIGVRTVPYLLNNYYNVPTDVAVTIFNENSSNIVNWYIFDADIIAAVVSASGLTQTLFFANDPFLRKFNDGDLVKIESLSTGFSVTKTVLSSTMTSITVNTIVGYPTGAIKISSLTSPVYSKDFTFANLVPTGIIKETTLPRENLFAAESRPNLRGVSFTIDKFGGVGVKPYNERLEVFDDTRIPGDFRLPVSMQSVDVFTTNTNIVPWYANDLDILTYLTGVNSVKTLYFDTQYFIPFVEGSRIKVSNGFFTRTFTVLIGTYNSVSFEQPTTAFLSENLYVERVTSSVYPTDSVVTLVSPTNARENLYYLRIRPLNKSTSGLGSTSLTPASGVIRSVPSLLLKGDSAKVTVSSTYLSIKVIGEPSKLGVSKVLTGNKLTSIETYPSKEVASSTSTTSLVWSATPIYIYGISGHSTSVANWYAFDEYTTALSVIDSNATYITLYLGVIPLRDNGTMIRLMQPNAGFIRDIPIVSYTADSITILNTFDLPNISNMYFFWGKDISTTTVSFTNNNRTPRINIVRMMNTAVFNTPQTDTLSKQLVKLSSDNNRYKVNTGVSFTSLISDRSYLTNKTEVMTVAVKGSGTPIKFSDTTRIIIDSRGRVDRFITSNYHSIMNGQAIQKKETIQFWN